MKHRPVVLATLLGGALAPMAASAAGMGNMTYTAAELEKPIANFGGNSAGRFPVGPTGSNTAVMLRNVLVIMGSEDSGKPVGAFHFYDISNPRSPRLLKSLSGTPETADLRELHAMPVAIIDGKDILVFPTISGIRFFDFTDPMNPMPVSSLELPGASGGDYDNANWMLSWSWPYVFVGATGSGVYIVDARDPSKPSIVDPGIPTGKGGNFRIGPTYAAGNYLVVLNMNEAPTHISVIDVGVPTAPFLLKTGTTPGNLYSAVVIGDHIFGPGVDGAYSFMKWSPTAITTIAQPTSGSDRGGYCTYQSGFVVCGQSSEGYKKWDVHNETAPVLVGHGTDPAGVLGDFDFATIMGNLVYLGNDHGTGAALIPHQMGPDTTAPEVMKVYPNDMAVKQPPSTRVTVFFSEDIDIGTMTSANLIVRKAGGTAVDGVYSRSSFNAVSFGARQPLEANTTYEVVINAGGLKDLVGNPIAAATISRFSTGASVQVPPTGAGGVSGAGTAGTSGTLTGAAGTTGAGTAGTGGVVTGVAGTSGSGVAGTSGTGVAGTSGTGAGGTTPTTGAAGTTSPTGAAGSAPHATGGDSGCGCNLAGRSSWSGGLFLSSLALWLVGRRPKQRGRDRGPNARPWKRKN